jgi:hypothetical protein
MRILLCAEITYGSTRKIVNLHVELVSDVDRGISPYLAAPECFCDDVHLTNL